MSIFHLHLRILSTRIDDRSGAEFPDLNAAAQEARRRARRMIAQRRLAGVEYAYDGIFEISDGAGTILRRVAVAEALAEDVSSDQRTFGIGAMKGRGGVYCNYRTNTARPSGQWGSVKQ